MPFGFLAFGLGQLPLHRPPRPAQRGGPLLPSPLRRQRLEATAPQTGATVPERRAARAASQRPGRAASAVEDDNAEAGAAQNPLTRLEVAHRDPHPARLEPEPGAAHARREERREDAQPGRRIPAELRAACEERRRCGAQPGSLTGTAAKPAALKAEGPVSVEDRDPQAEVGRAPPRLHTPGVLARTPLLERRPRRRAGGAGGAEQQRKAEQDRRRLFAQIHHCGTLQDQ
jgi:hypothetical protein